MTSSSEEEATPRGRLHCVACGAAADDDRERCSQCGAGLPRSKCPRCSTLLEWGAPSCTSCGYQFENRHVAVANCESRAPRQLEEPLRLVLSFQKRMINRLSGDIQMTRELLATISGDSDERQKLEEMLSQMEQESVEFLEVQETVVEMGRVLKDMLDIKERGLRNATEALADEVRRRKDTEVELKKKSEAIQRLEAEIKSSTKEKEELRERIHLLQEGYTDVVQRQDIVDKAKVLLGILDGLLARLPKEHLDAFANSEDYKLYEEVMNQLNAGNRSIGRSVSIAGD